MGHIAEGEFPDDELTDILYMLESNDNFDELFDDLKNEDDGPGTKVRIGKQVFLLENIVKGLEFLQNQSSVYPVDGIAESLLRYLRK